GHSQVPSSAGPRPAAGTPRPVRRRRGPRTPPTRCRLQTPSTRPRTNRASRRDGGFRAAGLPTRGPAPPVDPAQMSTRPSAPRSVGFLHPRPLLLPLDHLDDQLLNIGVPAGLDVPRLSRLAVALQGAALGELVELSAVDLDEDALIL